MEERAKYQEFLNHLNKFESDGSVIKIQRKYDKEFAFERLKLDVKYNSIDQFAERLFFFGEKSRHLWKERFEKEIAINDTSNKAFEIIFDQINNLNLNKYPTDFMDNNKDVFEYFKILDNKSKFANSASELPVEKKKEIRKHYLTILHQLDENKYKGQSLYISGSESENQAQLFADDGVSIIINFWDLKQEKKSLEETDLPIFRVFPFPEEEEISVFGAVFPHYIYSFVYKGHVYPNPAIATENNFDISVMGGFTIQQDDFESRLKSKTTYKRMIEKNEDSYTIK